MDTETILIQAIFVPQGAEYHAVCRGLKQVNQQPPFVFATPAGALPIRQYLTTWLETYAPQAYPQVLLMGLCGGLSPDYRIGDAVLYDSCLGPAAIPPPLRKCDDALTKTLEARLSLPVVKGMTRDRAIATAIEKQTLHRQYQADVVDMEGYAVLEIFNQVGIKTAMVRTVSDDCHHDIPNLDTVFDQDGNLQPRVLMSSFGRQPIAAARLVRGAVRGLQALEKITTVLFNEPSETHLAQ